MSWRGNYAIRGRGRGRGRVGGGGGNASSRHSSGSYGMVGAHTEKRSRTDQGTADFLAHRLRALENKPYPAYHSLEGAWAFPTFTFYLDQAQSDPYASPSKVRVRMSHAHAGFPASTYDTRIHRTALADYILRRLHKVCTERRFDEKLKGSGWSSGKGGQLEIDVPGQQVLERTAVVVDDEGIEMRFIVGLPAHGRQIMGHLAATLLCEHVPQLVDQGLLYDRYEPSELQHHLETVEDQQVLRDQLDQHGLIAFVPNGARLARASGASDKLMSTCVPFQSPATLQVSLPVPHRGKIIGMGLKKRALHVCIGGGFHGKSTFLSALALGSFNFVPNDGREFVCTSQDVASVRSEDGRFVGSVDISAFIQNLPNGTDTSNFSTSNASGSTSCAAALMEALELGADLLVLDEDTTASNFLVRDSTMQSLVPNEPITPLAVRVRALIERTGVSIVLVCGSSSALLPEADVVLQMDSYVMKDVTEHAKDVCKETHVLSQSDADAQPFAARKSRTLALPLPSVKTSTPQRSLIHIGEHALDLSSVPQLVHKSQTRAIETLLRRWMNGEPHSIRELVDTVDKNIESQGIDALLQTRIDGFLARPRRMDIGIALNRLRCGSWSIA